jgi:hypothetical protein
LRSASELTKSSIASPKPSPSSQDIDVFVFETRVDTCPKDSANLSEKEARKSAVAPEKWRNCAGGMSGHWS